MSTSSDPSPTNITISGSNNTTDLIVGSTTSHISSTTSSSDCSGSSGHSCDCHGSSEYAANRCAVDYMNAGQYSLYMVEFLNVPRAFYDWFTGSRNDITKSSLFAVEDTYIGSKTQCPAACSDIWSATNECGVLNVTWCNAMWEDAGLIDYIQSVYTYMFQLEILQYLGAATPTLVFDTCANHFQSGSAMNYPPYLKVYDENFDNKLSGGKKLTNPARNLDVILSDLNIFYLQSFIREAMEVNHIDCSLSDLSGSDISLCANWLTGKYTLENRLKLTDTTYVNFDVSYIKTYKDLDCSFVYYAHPVWTRIHGTSSDTLKYRVQPGYDFRKANRWYGRWMADCAMFTYAAISGYIGLTTGSPSNNVCGAQVIAGLNRKVLADGKVCQTGNTCTRLTKIFNSTDDVPICKVVDQVHKNPPLNSNNEECSAWVLAVQYQVNSNPTSRAVHLIACDENALSTRWQTDPKDYFYDTTKESWKSYKTVAGVPGVSAPLTFKIKSQCVCNNYPDNTVYFDGHKGYNHGLGPYFPDQQQHIPTLANNNYWMNALPDGNGQIINTVFDLSYSVPTRYYYYDPSMNPTNPYYYVNKTVTPYGSTY